MFDTLEVDRAETDPSTTTGVNGGILRGLRSFVEGLRREAVPQLPDARLEEDFAELQRLGELLEAERLRRLAEIDRRRLFERDGFLSAASWLVSRFALAWGAAHEHVRLARALDRMVRARAAFDRGAIGLSALRVLASAHDVDPRSFGRAEAELTEAARIHSVGDLRRVVAFWRQGVETEHALAGEDALRQRRRLHASVTLLGSVRVDGDLDPETGESLLTALRAVLDTEARSRGDDDRTPAQRRADALGEICRQWLDRGGRPSVAGERPHVSVTVGIEALRGEAAGCELAPTWTSELDHTGPVPAQTARQLACDASIMRVVLAGRSEPLDVGRRTPVVPPAVRRAVIVRDRHCRFPGCDRPQAWCDAHHVVHWADGGPTSLPNLLLLCRRHHGMVHRTGGFRLELLDGRPVFRRPDGSILADRGPP
jgi:uncharacterized protein DUF222/HNH endonuclease